MTHYKTHTLAPNTKSFDILISLVQLKTMTKPMKKRNSTDSRVKIAKIAFSLSTLISSSVYKNLALGLFFGPL